MAQDTMANRWLVCELAMQKFAIPAAYITEIIKMRGSIGQTSARCLVNGEVVSEAELKFVLMER